MGRRSKAEQYGLVEKIIKLYTQGKTVSEISEELTAEGFEISKSSVHRTVKSWEELLTEYKVATAQAKAFVEAIGTGSNTDFVETGVALLSNEIIELFRALRSIEIHAEDLEGLNKKIEGLNRLALSLQRIISTQSVAVDVKEKTRTLVKKIEAEAEKQGVGEDFKQFIIQELKQAYGL